MKRHLDKVKERICCDGGCTLGLGCPAYAPGVIEGPARRAARQTPAQRLHRGLWRGVRALVLHLLGPHP